MVRQNLVHQVYEHLSRLIAEGRLRPGDKLPQRDVAKALGVSPIPLREALRRLESEGIVHFTPSGGAEIAVVSVARVREGHLITQALEPLALRAAFPRMGPDDFDRLEAVLEKLANCPSSERPLLGWEFYRILLGPCGLPTVFEIIRREAFLGILSYPIYDQLRPTVLTGGPNGRSILARLRQGELDEAIPDLMLLNQRGNPAPVEAREALLPRHFPPQRSVP